MACQDPPNLTVPAAVVIGERAIDPLLREYSLARARSGAIYRALEELFRADCLPGLAQCHPGVFPVVAEEPDFVGPWCKALAALAADAEAPLDNLPGTRSAP